uniref:5'-nucleotidase n=3 Tax=Trichobilharzia regenti TaxID=157069 RepID=A0AA85JNB3_TRIRE|nr:unnamed protein product [Trichobilharzia regenti]
MSKRENYCSAAQRVCGVLSSLSKDNRLVRVNDKLVDKLSKFLSYGAQNIQVVCDFDHTLSKYCHNSEKVPVCHGLFMRHPRIPEVSRRRLEELCELYMPLGSSDNLSESEKCSLMMEFWKLAHRTLVDGNIYRSDVDCCALEGGIVLRDNAIDFLNKLADLNIPLIIFSGGIGNIIEVLLASLNVSLDNVRIVSNFMDFNAEGRLVGFQDPVIHSLNKTYKIIQNSEYYETVLSKRICTLLIGDSDSDANMLDNKQKFSGEQAIVIRIGYLNEKVDERMELFSSLYDIVLVNDETFDIPLVILSSIFNTDKFLKNNEDSNANNNSNINTS